VTITGNIAASVDLHVDGAVEGDISCAALVQGADSRITGHVTARTARLAGLVDGSITAEELIVESSARITGDIAYERITIEAGGRVEGRFTHKDTPPVASGVNEAGLIGSGHVSADPALEDASAA